MNHGRHIRLAKTFAREYLRPAADAVLTATECLENFNGFCLENSLEPVTRRIFKPLMPEVVRELYAMSLRHDVLGRNGRQQNIDIREFLTTKDNAVVAQMLGELLSGLSAQDQALFRSHVAGSFDFRADKVVRFVSKLRYKKWANKADRKGHGQRIAST